MTLDSIMTMAKADRYTDEGKKEINDARRTYKVGERSETNPDMIKTANGWRNQPQKGGAGSGEISAPKNAGRGDYLTIGKQKVRIDYAELGRYGSEVGTLLQYTDPETKKNKYILQTKSGELKESDADGNVKPAKESEKKKTPKITDWANRYYMDDANDLSDEDKVFKALNIDLDESFGDEDGDPANVEAWANDWLTKAKNEGGIGIKSRDGKINTAVSGEDIERIKNENPQRWNRIVKNAKKFYSGKGRSSDFESNEFYPERKTKDAAPLTGDTKIKVRK